MLRQLLPALAGAVGFGAISIWTLVGARVIQERVIESQRRNVLFSRSTLLGRVVASPAYLWYLRLTGIVAGVCSLACAVSSVRLLLR
jgi:hypothetical protein